MDINGEEVLKEDVVNIINVKYKIPTLKQDLLLDKKAFEASMIHDENVDIKEDFEYKKYFVENFASIILSLSCFNLIMIIKSLLMTIFQLKMYFNVYKKRIDKNEKDTKFLDFLNETTGLKMFSNIKTWADFVFKNINPDQDTFTYEKSIFVFGEERTKLIFDLFDMNNDKSVTSFEFISVYFGVIRDRYFLSKAFILGYASYFKNIISVISGILLSLSFIFSSVVGEMFRSLIFIFLVRPFETGDYIKINDELMVVQELGILYSSFLINGLVTYIENTKIMDKKIINYRISDVEEKTYKYRFNNILFRKVRNQLHDKLQNILKQNTKIYTGKFKLTNYKIINEFIDVEIVIAFKINYQYIKGLANNEDNIVFILEDIFKELMLN
ncbi:small-conductance mechanosensitive channel protein [Vairimorpha apis BRL 01]|uniref:Small-conductance mechanosensitive channel protein n=1 Tax=Vairimorpha apis BRL 01 TaxID=1037528 RepID=T0LDL0_9MICR|nr:small-conductance mechanosensitive channel protein [Vairimorpha apis BRL 01]